MAINSTLRKLNKNIIFFGGAIIVVFFVFIAVFAPFITIYDPEAIDMMSIFLPPSDKHFFGTDELGRDVFSRVVYGSRISLFVGIVAVGISVAAGVVLGLISGYFGG